MLFLSLFYLSLCFHFKLLYYIYSILLLLFIFLFYSIYFSFLSSILFYFCIIFRRDKKKKKEHLHFSICEDSPPVNKTIRMQLKSSSG